MPANSRWDLIRRLRVNKRTNGRRERESLAISDARSEIGEPQG